MLSPEYRTLLRKADLVGVLERLCQSLELSDAQYRVAKDRYEGVGTWLADGDSSILRALAIYLQGSTALGTTVKPIGRNEHDVDLVAHIPGLGIWIEPATVKRAIGEQLNANGHYAPLVEEMPRCWRLNYANEFHLDITPSIPNPQCAAGGELVPDKKVRAWSASNPRGLKSLFERRANLTPRMRLAERTAKGLRAEIEPYPMSGGPKGILRRTVQIVKRHRDHHFLKLDSSLAPISVIVTTLASRSYEYCVGRFVYDSEFDVVCDVIRHMPDFIETRTVAGECRYFIWNETTTNENFAEKWNDDPRRAQGFWAWHARALSDLESLADIEGLDRLTKQLSEAFGSRQANQALAGRTADVSSGRQAGRLSVVPGVGLSLGPARHSTGVRPNTFFGSD